MEKVRRWFNLAQSRFLSFLIYLEHLFVTLACTIFILRQLCQIFSAPKFLHFRYNVHLYTFNTQKMENNVLWWCQYTFVYYEGSQKYLYQWSSAIKISQRGVGFVNSSQKYFNQVCVINISEGGSLLYKKDPKVLQLKLSAQ